MIQPHSEIVVPGLGPSIPRSWVLGSSPLLSHRRASKAAWSHHLYATIRSPQPLVAQGRTKPWRIGAAFSRSCCVLCRDMHAKRWPKSIMPAPRCAVCAAGSSWSPWWRHSSPDARACATMPALGPAQPDPWEAMLTTPGPRLYHLGGAPLVAGPAQREPAPYPVRGAVPQAGGGGANGDPGPSLPLQGQAVVLRRLADRAVAVAVSLGPFRQPQGGGEAARRPRPRRLPAAAAARDLRRCPERAALRLSHQQLPARRPHHRRVLQGALADRAVLQVDQAEPADQELRRGDDQRRAHPDLDRPVRVSAAGLCEVRQQARRFDAAIAAAAASQPLPTLRSACPAARPRPRSTAKMAANSTGSGMTPCGTAVGQARGRQQGNQALGWTTSDAPGKAGGCAQGASRLPAQP